MNEQLVQKNNLPKRETLSSFALLGYYANAAMLEVALQQNTHSTLPNFLMFTAANEGFLIDLENVNSVIREQPMIKKLPFAPAWFRGLSSIRNEIVSVVSFSMLWCTEKSSSDHRKKHYILLRGEMEGYLLEIDELIGIKSLEAHDTALTQRFIDGYAHVDGLKWQRININALLETELKNKMEF